MTPVKSAVITPPGQALNAVNELPVTVTVSDWPCCPELGATDTSAGVDPVTVNQLGRVAISPPVATVTLSTPIVRLPAQSR